MENTETKQSKIYADYKGFQGDTFENNIKSINKLHLGQNIKISDVPFIIKPMNSNKYYLAANRIILKSQMEKNIFYITKKFIYLVLQ